MTRRLQSTNDSTLLILGLVLLIAFFGVIFFLRDTITSALSSFFSIVHPLAIIFGLGFGGVFVWFLLNRRSVVIITTSVLLLTVGVVSVLAQGNVVEIIQGNDAAYVCSGTIEVDLLGFGKPSISDTSLCTQTTCSLFPPVQSLSFFGDSGRLDVVVDGVVVGSQEFSSFGSDRDFVVETSCVARASTIEAVLYEEGSVVERRDLI